MGVNGPLTLAPDKANLAFYLLEYFSLNYVAQKYGKIFLVLEIFGFQKHWPKKIG